MGQNTRIINKFEYWSVDDCDCSLCVHHTENDSPCPLDACCITDIKAEAILREVSAENKLAAASVKGVRCVAVA